MLIRVIKFCRNGPRFDVTTNVLGKFIPIFGRIILFSKIDAKSNDHSVNSFADSSYAFNREGIHSALDALVFGIKRSQHNLQNKKNQDRKKCAAKLKIGGDLKNLALDEYR